jgi:tripartite-type tricarboxylate transporter receptor subunit TctC
VVPRAAGGVVDVVARRWAEEAKQRLGNIVVENQGGAGGLIGATTVAQAKPDGYTLLAGTNRGANPGLVDFYAGQLPMFAASISPQVLAMHDRGVIRILMARALE